MKVAVHNITGKETTKKVDLSKNVFGVEPNDHAIYLDVKQYLENSVDGCTSFAILPKMTDINNLIIGQNWDWIPDIDCALTTSTDSDGLQRLSYTEAGIFAGKPGMNSEGIGLAVNGMYSTSDNWSRLKKPFHLL